MKIVVMVDKSAGNDSVGSMWTETYIFDGETKLSEVINSLGYGDNAEYQRAIGETIRLQIGVE